jgi:hypothetical protein
MVFLKDIIIFGAEIGFLYNNSSNPIHRSRGNTIHNLDLGKCCAALDNGSTSHQHTTEQELPLLYSINDYISQTCPCHSYCSNRMIEAL